jgi:hypothetical protein
MEPAPLAKKAKDCALQEDFRTTEIFSSDPKEGGTRCKRLLSRLLDKIADR